MTVYLQPDPSESAVKYLGDMESAGLVLDQGVLIGIFTNKSTSPKGEKGDTGDPGPDMWEIPNFFPVLPPVVFKKQGTAPKLSQVWADDTNEEIKVWNGSAWEVISYGDALKPFRQRVEYHNHPPFFGEWDDKYVLINGTSIPHQGETDNTSYYDFALDVMFGNEPENYAWAGSSATLVATMPPVGEPANRANFVKRLCYGPAEVTSYVFDATISGDTDSPWHPDYDTATDPTKMTYQYRILDPMEAAYLAGNPINVAFFDHNHNDRNLSFGSMDPTEYTVTAISKGAQAWITVSETNNLQQFDKIVLTDNTGIDEINMYAGEVLSVNGQQVQVDVDTSGSVGTFTSATLKHFNVYEVNGAYRFLINVYRWGAKLYNNGQIDIIMVTSPSSYTGASTTYDENIEKINQQIIHIANLEGLSVLDMWQYADVDSMELYTYLGDGTHNSEEEQRKIAAGYICQWARGRNPKLALETESVRYLRGQYTDGAVLMYEGEAATYSEADYLRKYGIKLNDPETGSGRYDVSPDADTGEGHTPMFYTSSTNNTIYNDYDVQSGGQMTMVAAPDAAFGTHAVECDEGGDNKGQDNIEKRFSTFAFAHASYKFSIMFEEIDNFNTGSATTPTLGVFRVLPALGDPNAAKLLVSLSFVATNTALDRIKLQWYENTWTNLVSSKTIRHGMVKNTVNDIEIRVFRPVVNPFGENVTGRIELFINGIRVITAPYDNVTDGGRIQQGAIFYNGNRTTSFYIGNFDFRTAERTLVNIKNIVERLETLETA